jgi:hypothetical protein
MLQFLQGLADNVRFFAQEFVLLTVVDRCQGHCQVFVTTLTDLEMPSITNTPPGSRPNTPPPGTASAAATASSALPTRDRDGSPPRSPRGRAPEALTALGGRPATAARSGSQQSLSSDSFHTPLHMPDTSSRTLGSDHYPVTEAHGASAGVAPSAADTPAVLAADHESWKNDVNTKRQAFFGAHYSPEMDTDTFDKKFAEMGRGLEPALLAFVTQGLSSAITFGTRGGVATSLKALGYSAGAAGAMAGLPMGAANFLTERLVLAPINHASEQMKRPVLTPVPPDVLFPDRSVVKSVVVDGQVRLERKSPREILHDKKEVLDLRQDAARWQARATGKGFGSHVVASGVTGGNVARRLAHHFPSGPEAGGEIALASGVGGGLAGSALAMMKASLFAEVDNLNGGRQTLPMFVIKDNPEAAQAQEGDSHPAVQFAQHMGTHAVDQLKAMANKPLETATEALVTNMFANVVGSFLGESAAAQIDIGGKKSTATVAVGQMIQSYITSTTYRQSKNAFQVPEQNNWAGDINTQRDQRQQDVGQSTAVQQPQHPSAEGMRHRRGPGAT